MFYFNVRYVTILFVTAVSLQLTSVLAYATEKKACALIVSESTLSKKESPLSSEFYQNYIENTLLFGRKVNVSKKNLKEIKQVIDHLINENQLQRAFWIAKEFNFKTKASDISLKLTESLHKPVDSQSRPRRIVSGVYVIKLNDGSLAIFKYKTQANASKTNLNYDLAAFIISSRLGLNVVPHTFKRSVHIPGQGLKEGIITPFIKSIHMLEGELSTRISMLDFLINNHDRNGVLHNTLTTPEGWQVGIDHSFAFTFEYSRNDVLYGKEVLETFKQFPYNYNPGSKVLEQLRNYTETSIHSDLSPYVSERLIEHVLERRQLILQLDQSVIY